MREGRRRPSLLAVHHHPDSVERAAMREGRRRPSLLTPRWSPVLFEEAPQ